MADPITMMAIGAGVGALKGAVTGGNPFKEALIGGTIGGLTGGAGQALGLGGAAAGAGGAVGAGAKGAVDLGTKAAFEASMGLPSTAFLESGGSLATALGGTTKAMGLVPTTAGSALSYNPEYYSNILGNQVYKGGEGVLSNAIGQFTPSMDDLKQYASIDNLKGAAMVANQFQPRPMSPAPQGRITQGQAPQGGLGGGGVEGLLAELQKRQQQQYQPISLL
jgi:hypothetical protein